MIIILFVLHPLFWITYTAAFIAIFPPWEYLKLWIANLIAVWSILLFPLNRNYGNSGSFDFLANIVINGFNLILLIGTAIVITIRLLKKHELSKKSTKAKLASFLSFVICGILSAYFVYLFMTDLWYKYQAPWHAYSTILIISIIAITSCLLSHKYIHRHRFSCWVENLYVFI